MTAVLLSLGLALVYLVIIRFLDLNEREPLWAVLVMLALGFAAGGILNLTVPGIWLELTFLRGAAIEEAAKFAAMVVGFTFLWLNGRSRGWSEINGPMDGIVYGAAVGFGFATGEAFFRELLFGAEAVGPMDDTAAPMIWSSALAGLAHGVLSATRAGKGTCSSRTSTSAT